MNILSGWPRRLRRAVRCAACIDQPGSFNPDLSAGMPLPELDEKGQKAHAQFMTYVFDLIDGTRDSSQYEDDVRALLGVCSRVPSRMPVLEPSDLPRFFSSREKFSHVAPHLPPVAPLLPPRPLG